MTSIDNILERTCGELPSHPWLRWAAILFSLFVLSIQISLAAAQIFLSAAGILYLAYLLKVKPRIWFLPVKLPLALFCVLSVVSVFFSANPAVGWFAVRKLVLFLVWLLAVNVVVSRQHLRRLLQGLFIVSLLASLVAIVQFVIQYHDVEVHHPDRLYYYLTLTRIHGFTGHWMNFGGQQMLVFAFFLAFLLLAPGADRNSKLETGNRKLEIGDSRLETGNWKIETQTPSGQERRPESGMRIPESHVGDGLPQAPVAGEPQFPVSSFPFRLSFFWWVVLAIVTLSIVLNFTRGVWLGCLLEAVYLVARWRPKWLWVLLLLPFVGYVGAPSLVRQRLHGAMHPAHDPALSIRFEMWHVALNMIRAHPWVGVGPNNVEEEYVLYLPPGKSPELGYHNHFHNDYLQFGAERGLPCLAAWLWLMGALGWQILKVRRKSKSPRDRWIADGGFAAWLALLAEGCFEFNFGTSPVLVMFLFVTATPFISSKVDASTEVQAA